MLAIRMQRTGRKGHTQFRVVVQDSHFHPTRGRVVAYVGSYDPHTKSANLDKESVSKYLGNGAQPSDRVVRLLRAEGVKLPDWVKAGQVKERSIRNPEKLRRNQPKEVPAEVQPATEEPTASADAPAGETTIEAEQVAPADAEPPVEETPAPEVQADSNDANTTTEQ